MHFLRNQRPGRGSEHCQNHCCHNTRSQCVLHASCYVFDSTLFAFRLLRVAENQVYRPEGEQEGEQRLHALQPVYRPEGEQEGEQRLHALQPVYRPEGEQEGEQRLHQIEGQLQTALGGQLQLQTGELPDETQLTKLGEPFVYDERTQPK